MSGFSKWLFKMLKIKRRSKTNRGPVKFLATVVVFDNMRFPPVLIPVSENAHAYFTAVSLAVSEVSKQVGAQYPVTSEDMMGYYAGQTVSELLHQRPITEGIIQRNSKLVMVSHRPIMVHVESLLSMSDSLEYKTFMRNRRNRVTKK